MSRKTFLTVFKKCTSMRHKHLNAVFLQLKRKALKHVLKIPLILETFNFTGYQIGIIFVD